MKKLFFYLTTFGVALAALFSVLGYFGYDSWLLDMFCNFRPQYLIILVFGISTLFFWKKWLAIAFIPFLMLDVYEVGNLYWSGDHMNASEHQVKIVSVNLLSSNTHYEKVAQFIESENPDIVVLQEFNARWGRELAPSLTTYKSRLEIAQRGNFGIAVYSRIPFKGLRKVTLGKIGVPSILGQFQLGSESISLLATHPVPPLGQEQFLQRNDQLEEIADFITSLNGEVIVLGDLNISSFSVHFKSLMEQTNLKDSRQGEGLLTTWPARIKILHTTLDHCLVSNQLNVLDRRKGPFVGSDHLPIIVELGVE